MKFLMAMWYLRLDSVLDGEKEKVPIANRMVLLTACTPTTENQK